ncbi:MAG: PAS domain-containing protein [Vicinamibacterales bacterium]
MTPPGAVTFFLAVAAVAGWGAFAVVRRRASGAGDAPMEDAARLAALLEATGDGAAILDRDGAVLQANAAWATLRLPTVTASAPPDGWDVRDRNGRLLDRSAWPIARILRGETITRYELQLTAPHAPARRVVSISGAALPTPSGGHAGAVVVVRDLTSARAALGQSRRAREIQAVGLAAAGIAHDFNNTLTVALASASLLRQAAAERPELLRDADNLTAAARRSSALTRVLLVLTRREPPRTERVHPGGSVRELEPILRRLLPPAAILEVVDHTGEADVVLGDPRALQLFLIGIIGGARPSVLQGGCLRLTCDAGEFVEPKTLVTGRFVRVSLEGPTPMLDHDDAGPWGIGAMLPDVATAPGRTVCRTERQPDGRARFDLLLPAAPAVEPATDPQGDTRTPDPRGAVR